MLLMHCTAITPRLKYIVDFFSQELFDEPIVLTTSRSYYAAHQGPKLNYDHHEISDDEVLIAPAGLLFETGIRQQSISCFELNFHKAFFQTAGDLHFDVFSAAFFLITRYEEYLPHEKDAYGRYPHTASLAFREGFLHLPLVNIWLHEFKRLLQERFPDLRFRGGRFRNMITYDVDIAYSYLHKGWLRNLGGTLRSLFRGQWSLVVERWQVLFGKKRDPFDCFEWLDALHLYCRIKPHYFFLVARKPSKYDKNVSTSAKPLQELIEYYSSAYHVGVHPSWQSGDDPALLREEIEWVEVVGDRKVRSSRQHYLRFSLPETFRKLMDAGIEHEFSMGYGTINGFRASVSSPFPWYDLEAEESTRLTVYPFCFMDANAFYETQSSPKEAYEELMRYYDVVKKVNGTFITLWHNHLLGSDRRTTGWNAMFELFMKEVVYWDAYADGDDLRKSMIRHPL